MKKQFLPNSVAFFAIVTLGFSAFASAGPSNQHQSQPKTSVKNGFFSGVKAGKNRVSGNQANVSVSGNGNITTNHQVKTGGLFNRVNYSAPTVVNNFVVATPTASGLASQTPRHPSGNCGPSCVPTPSKVSAPEPRYYTGPVYSQPCPPTPCSQARYDTLAPTVYTNPCPTQQQYVTPRQAPCPPGMTATYASVPQGGTPVIRTYSSGRTVYVDPSTGRELGPAPDPRSVGYSTTPSFAGGGYQQSGYPNQYTAQQRPPQYGHHQNQQNPQRGQGGGGSPYPDYTPGGGYAQGFQGSSNSGHRPMMASGFR